MSREAPGPDLEKRLILYSFEGVHPTLLRVVKPRLTEDGVLIRGYEAEIRLLEGTRTVRLLREIRLNISGALRNTYSLEVVRKGQADVLNIDVRGSFGEGALANRIWHKLSKRTPQRNRFA